MPKMKRHRTSGGRPQYNALHMRHRVLSKEGKKRRIQPFDKNPVHPSTLRLRDVHRGVTYAHFNPRVGLSMGEFVSEPYVTRFGTIYVRVRENGRSDVRSLVDMGIVPIRDRWWYTPNYTVRASKIHLVPASLLRVFSRERLAAEQQYLRTYE